MNGQFTGLFSSVIGAEITLTSYLICTLAAIISGVVLAFVFGITDKTKKHSFSFLSSVVLLPFIVGTVIMLVNGNVGTGVAVAGAFSLVRFRSAPGSARDITIIFLAMASGLAVGTGYIGVCGLLTVIGALIVAALAYVGAHTEGAQKELRIVIPENIDYEGIFDEVFKEYTGSHTLIGVKTTNMGSLFKLKYKITLKPNKSEKAFIDALRIRNGNLEINISASVSSDETL